MSSDVGVRAYPGHACPDDADLIYRASREEPDAFSAVVRRWENRIYDYLLRFTRDRDDALDLSQKVFMKAYCNLRYLKHIENFEGWLYRIAHNEACSLCRMRRRNGVSFEERFEPLKTRITLGTTALERPEVKLMVASAVDRLSRDHREVIVLRMYYGLAFGEIATALACPVSTVKSRLYAAIAVLKSDFAL